MNKLGILTAIALSFSVITSCQSKVNERKPEGFSDKTSTEFKVNSQVELDQKISQLQVHIGNLKHFISQVQTLVKTQGEITSLSMFDVVQKMNEKALEQLPTLKNQKFLSQGQFQIPSSLLDKKCQTFAYKIAAESVIPLNEIKYSLASCYSVDFFDVMTADFSEGRVEFKFNELNLKRVLPSEVLEPKITACTFSTSATESTTCKDIMFAQTKQLVWYLDVVSLDGTTATVRGLSKKTGAIIFDGKLKVSAAGQIEEAYLNGPLVNEK
ncbi:MAG: hypothetical protein H7328_03935 [Bdellovibrio sp.]|nr:hypothetical protein [Bdellovibrio sp.]